MATIDIRDEATIQRVDNIIYGSGEAQIERDDGMDRINLYVAGGRWLALNKYDIPNLIKAFEKAKELGWMEEQPD